MAGGQRRADDGQVSVWGVAVSIAGIVETASEARLVFVAEQLDDLADLLAAVAKGSDSLELAAATASLCRACVAARDACAAALAGCGALVDYLHTGLVLVDRGTGSSDSVRSARERLNEYGVAGQQLASLPSMDEEAAITGQAPRTRGRWLTSPTGKPEQRDSGHDGYSEVVATTLRELGILNPRIPTDRIVAHLEIRLAVAMRNSKQEGRREVLVINNPNVCARGKPYAHLNCQNLLPKILLPGQEIVIYSPIRGRDGMFRWVFRGGEEYDASARYLLVQTRHSSGASEPG